MHTNKYKHALSQITFIQLVIIPFKSLLSFLLPGLVWVGGRMDGMGISTNDQGLVWEQDLSSE